MIYATVLGVQTEDISLKMLGKNKGNAKIKNIEVLGSEEKLFWEQYADSLVITKSNSVPNKIAVVFKIQKK